MPEEQRPEQEPNITDFLRNLQPQLLAELPQPQQAETLVDTLNEIFRPDLGKMITVDCGRQYIVGDGAMRGSHILIGREIGDHPINGLKDTGRLLRFEVLNCEDKLLSRGTPIEVAEPCLVYEETPHRVHSMPESEVTEVFVPIASLGSTEIRE